MVYIKRILIALTSFALLVAAGAAGAQSMDKMDSMDSMMYMPVPQTCTMLPDSIMVSSGSYNIQCQQVSGAGIGIPSILNAGVIDAVDVWGSEGVNAEVCFTASGSITFLDAMYSPRAQMSVEYGMRDGMTCASIGTAGTVVLMPSMMMDEMDSMAAMDSMPSMDAMVDEMDAMDKMDDEMGAMDEMDAMDDMDKMDDLSMDYAMMKDSMDSMVALEDCEVVSRYNLNFRDEPGGEKIGLVPGATMKSAVARTPNWFKVEHDEVLGWITAHYVTTEGDCG